MTNFLELSPSQMRVFHLNHDYFNECASKYWPKKKGGISIFRPLRKIDVVDFDLHLPLTYDQIDEMAKELADAEYEALCENSASNARGDNDRFEDE